MKKAGRHGKPIQPVYTGHVDWYVDYSHGVRLINNNILINNVPMLFSDVLKDPVLYKLFSDEPDFITHPKYCY